MDDAGDSQAPPLRIIIVGAGMGGLTAAIGLVDKGHKVTVFEATKELVTAGAGLQVPPPSTRILRAWGLDSAFEPMVVLPRTFTYHNYADGRILGTIPINPFSEQQYGSPWWCVHRADYQWTLFEAAIKRGVCVHLDHRVTDIDTDSTTVTVQHNGVKSNYVADLIIGADGIRSSVRNMILDNADPGLRPSTICAYRALIPRSAMIEDELRAPLLDPENAHVDVWLGPSHFLLSYPIRQDIKAQYNLVLVHPENDDHTTHDLPPHFPRPSFISEVSAHYTNFCSQVRSIVSVIAPEDASDYYVAQSGLAEKDGILEWKLAELDALPTWTSPQKTCVLVGDAAHAQKPYLSAGASAAMEDAAALATFLDRRHIARHGLPKLLEVFVAMRKPRAERYQTLSAADAVSWSLPDGPAQRRRDELLQFMGDEDRQKCADAMAKMRAEAIGEFNFGDSVFMDWAWKYDVVADAEDILSKMTSS